MIKITFITMAVLQFTLMAQQLNTYDRAFIAYREKHYDEADELFEKAFYEKNNPIYSAYMIGYINLYYKEVNYIKAIRFLSEVEKNIPDDINKNYLFNHLGVSYLYKALDKKGVGKPYVEDLNTSVGYLFKAFKSDSNDITLNNIGRAKVEFPDIETVLESAKYFHEAYEFYNKPTYLHNEATAYERVGHFLHEEAIRDTQYDQKKLEESHNYFVKALKLYKRNSASEKSQDRANIIQQNILSLNEFKQFK